MGRNIGLASKSPPSSLPSQASNQTDLENWVTAIHSASASLLAKRQGKEDTVRLLRSQVRGLLQKIDMDGKMKKMAELQLTVVSNPKNRKAIENQVSGTEWEEPRASVEIRDLPSRFHPIKGEQRGPL